MKILTITRLTFRETVRRKIMLTALILGAAFLIIFNLGFYFIKYQGQISSSPLEGIQARGVYNVFLLMGLYALNFLALAMAALVSADTLAGEISSGTIQSIASKPIRRVEIVFGKWLGFAILLLGYILMMAGGLILSVWVQTGYQPDNILAGLALMYFETLIMMTLTLLFSSTLSTLATGAAVFGLYGLAFIGSWVEQIGSYLNSRTAVQIGILASLLMPAEALWRRASYELTSPLVAMLNGGPFISRSVPSPMMIIYAGVYLGLVFWFAVRRFQKRGL